MAGRLRQRETGPHHALLGQSSANRWERPAPAATPKLLSGGPLAIADPRLAATG